MTSGLQRACAAFILALMMMTGSLMPARSAQRNETLDKVLALTGHLLIQPRVTPLTDWRAVAEGVSSVRGYRRRHLTRRSE
jgi:hypothetical protein